MTSITATLQADPVLPWIQIDVVIDNPGTVTGWSVTRVAPPHLDVMIKVDSASTGAASIEDHEAPLAVPVTYRLAISRGPATEEIVSNVVELTGTAGCFLSDPYSGAVMAIEVQSWPERRFASRSAALEVIGRADPVGLADVHTWAAGTWTLLTRTDVQTTLMLDILRASGVALLRTQPDTSIPTVYALVGEIAETRISNRGLDQRRLTPVGMQEISPIPAAARNLDATLLGLSTLGDTLYDLSLVRPTLLQLSQIRTG